MAQSEFITVIPSRGLRVHAVSLIVSTRTACGRDFSGWRVSPQRLNCGRCKNAILKAGR